MFLHFRGLHGAPGQPLPCALKPQWLPRATRWSRTSPLHLLPPPHLPALSFSPPHCVPLLCPCGESAPSPASTIFCHIPGHGALSEGCAFYGPLPLHPPWVPSPCSSRSCCTFAELNPVRGFLIQANRYPQIFQLRSVCQWELSRSFYVGEAEAPSRMLTGLASHSRSRRAGCRCPAWGPLAVSLDSAPMSNSACQDPGMLLGI